jgi:hypothetical protein
MTKLSALTVATLLIATATPADAAPVTWTFITTNCAAFVGTCNGGQMPGTYVPLSLSLTLPGPTSSGSAHWGQPGNPDFSSAPVYTGDTFLLSLSDAIPLTPAYNGMPNCTQAHGAFCDFNISWFENAGVLGISIALETQNSDLGTLPPASGSPFGPTGGNFAGMSGDGCGLGSNCVLTGYWQSNLVTEPISAIMVLSGLLGLALARRFLRPSVG